MTSSTLTMASVRPTCYTICVYTMIIGTITITLRPITIVNMGKCYNRKAFVCLFVCAVDIYLGVNRGQEALQCAKQACHCHETT